MCIHSSSQTDISVDGLFKSNSQWAAEVSKNYPGFFPASAKNRQTPHVLWIGCADSRAPETTLLGLLPGPGEVFAHRNIGNQLREDDDTSLSVLQYAVENLVVDGVGSVEHIVIAGHTVCGAVAAAYDKAFPPPAGFRALEDEIYSAGSPLDRWLQPLVNLAKATIDPSIGREAGIARLTQFNVQAQVDNVVNSEIVRSAWKRGSKVQVHGWIYTLDTGRLRDLRISVGPDGPITVYHSTQE